MPQVTTVHATVEFRYRAWGGIASALDLMVAAAQHARHDTLILTLGSRDALHRLSPNVRVCTVGLPELEGQPLYRSERRVQLGQLAAQRVTAMLPRLTGGSEADLLVHSEELGTLLRTSTGVRRRVFVSHGLAVQEHPHRPDLVEQERRTLAAADTVAVLSDAQAGMLRHAYPELGNVRVMPLPLILLTEQIRPVSAAEFGRGPIVAAGRSVRQKGFDILLQAVRATQNADCAGEPSLPPVIVYTGHGDTDCLDECRRLAADCGSRVTLRPWLPRKQLLAALRRARVVCVPSRFEPVGLIAAEALALGIPVVASHVGGLPDLLGSTTRTGWTVPVIGDDGPTPGELTDCLVMAARRTTGPTAGPEELRRWPLDQHLSALAHILDR
ncbi:glycosyltransferase family 4 protein [Streptomyces parvulus]|uniref:glycosyltransferase family 4 protein n=1 Tax=Streptomyces parvulus TaxID=146923 RepID=UPI0038206F60